MIPLVSLSGATVGYPGRPLLKDVSLALQAGVVVAIVGPNGSGKSTLLRSLVGILPLLEGQLRYDFDRRLHPLGYVPQRDSLDPIFPVTALDVVKLGTMGHRSTAKPDRRRAHEQAEESLGRVGLLELGGRSFSELSVGQRQRVLIARALCTQSKIIFLDEPTTGADPGAEAAILALLLELHRESNLTIVIVSHDLAAVRKYIPATIVVHNGSAEMGDTASLLNLPRIETIFGFTDDHSF